MKNLPKSQQILASLATPFATGVFLLASLGTFIIVGGFNLFSPQDSEKNLVSKQLQVLGENPPNPNPQVLGEETENPPTLPLEKGGATDQLQLTNLPLSQRGIKGVLSSCHNCITTKNIKDSSIDSKKIQNKSILSSDIKSNQINSRLIEDQSIQREDLTSSLQEAIYATTEGLVEETDPIFLASEAANFISGDKTKLDSLNNYTLPTASSSTLGGIKIGARLTVTNGVLSADIQAGTGAVDSVNDQTGIIILDPDDLDDSTTTHKFVSASQITNWTTAHSWGNHATSGYLTSYNETDPIFITWDKSTGIEITESQISDLQTYLTTYSETDPTISAWAKAATKPTYTATEIGLGNVPNLTFSGSNTGDETTSSIKTKLGAASTTLDGYLTTTDWNTFNNKQPALGFTPYNSTNPSGYISSYTETDPVFLAWDKSTDISITESQISDLQTYLTAETDPIFLASQANNITASHITILGNTSNTNTGDNATNSQYSGLATSKQDALSGTGFVKITGTTISYDNSTYVTGTPWTGMGYLTSYDETDPIFIAWDKSTGISITESQISNLQTYLTAETDPRLPSVGTTGNLLQSNGSAWISWTPNYLTSETDPIFTVHSASTITADNITNWTTAHSWGNHASSGYLTSYNETDPVFLAWDKSTGIEITESQISDLQTYLTTETDPIFSASQANNITASHITILGNTSNTNTGDETQSSIQTKLGSASTTLDGYLLATDWNIFNNKQPAGSYLTSYNETDPVFASSQASNITATHITTLNNTSGTNTGDQSAADILADLETVDGSTSGLDADLFDGFDSSAFGDATAANQLDIISRIGTNDANNTFDSSAVVANADGSVMERLDYIQGKFSCGESIQDADGNVYGTVQIGNQCWQASNMRTTKYPSGASITRGPTGATWDGTDHGYYAYPPNVGNTGEENDGFKNVGFVYQWSAAMNSSTSEGAQGICPTGWHVPRDSEWHILEASLADGVDDCSEARNGVWACNGAGTSLKANGVSKFSAPLAGNRTTDGSFSNRATYAGFWSSSQSGSNAWNRVLYSTHATVSRNTYSKANGFSVRCLKD